MRRFRRSIFELFGLLLIGSAIGFSVNGARRDHIHPTKNYFDLSIDPARINKNVKDSGVAHDSSSAGQMNTSVANGASTAASGTIHGFKSVSAEEAFAMFSDARRQSGLYVFVDARNDERYAEGHIPGAVQCDHYRLKDYIDRVLDRTSGAERIIVYCNGGECEDSGLVCKDLLDADIPYDALNLFAGGWVEWTKRGYPTELGPGAGSAETDSTPPDSSEAEYSSDVEESSSSEADE